MARSRIVNLSNLQQFTAINVLSDPGAIGGFQQLPNCAQIRLGWSLESGKTGFNVLHGRYAGPFAGTAAQADAIKGALTSGGAWTALAGFLPTTQAFTHVSIRDMNTQGNPYIFSSGSLIPGTSVSAALPDETAAVISLATAKTGPSNRGRVYVPGWATNALGAGNVIAPAAVTALQNWANTIKAALSAQGYTWVIAQPARAAYTGSTGTQHPARVASSGVDVTTSTVRDNHWDSQRRRGLK